MANKNIPRGFELVWPKDAFCLDYLVADSAVLKAGDTVYMDSSGYASHTATNQTLGVAQDDMRIGTGSSAKKVTALGEADTYDYISVCIDINAIYKAQISTGALTSPYTTRSSAAAYDEAGDAGVQYIDAAASTNDTWRIVRWAAEYGDGSQSANSTYQKVFCKLNPAEAIFGTIA